MSRHILLSGLPGAMATAVARELLREGEGTRLRERALSGERHHGQGCEVDGTGFALVGPSHRGQIDAEQTIAIDYSTPEAAAENAAWFAERGVPFVMGTTGGDTGAIQRAVEGSEISAVVAPNMATPLVLLQAAFEDLAKRFPGALSGHGLRIVESHQATKRDTSGTAKAMARHFATLGLPATMDVIEKIRDPERSAEDMGVPREHLDGHAFHTYEIRSSDEDVAIRLEHNVLGRGVYARGTVTALRFLESKVEAGSRGEVFSMIDVLGAGAPIREKASLVV